MKMRRWLVGIFFLMGVVYPSAEAKIPEGFSKAEVYQEVTGYPYNLPTGWCFKEEVNGYHLVNPADEEFYAAMGPVIGIDSKIVEPRGIAEAVLKNRKDLSDEGRRQIVFVPGEAFGEYRVEGFWIHKLRSTKGPYVVLLFFVYREKPHFFFAVSRESEEALERKGKGLLKALLTGE